ncbi:AF4/FMR2 family member 4-like [Dendronephthya gigantea]|uniref:AF4/FMR2 family member 4-like n=1 Tax=Dendronephthya gigantea TaxID=151771 RepID=UPI00106DB743|nr:AF4/FMR2 family member 4-like [Dendronephthya gigantea]
MAQLRRYPNALPPYLGSHNMNGNSERVEQREKAKIARVQPSDIEMNKKPAGPLFPPPRKVNDSSDEITKTIKKSLGDFENFVKIMNQEVSREKAPGQTCIGVMPVPATPTENKTFALTNSKTKPTKDKPTSSTQEKSKGNTGIEKLEQKPLKLKSDQKHKSSLDASRHKALKLGEKLNDKKDNKDCNVLNKISIEKYKSNQASVADKSNTLSVNKQKLDTSANDKNEEVNSDIERVERKEEQMEISQQGPAKKLEKSTAVQKTKPTPLQLPTRTVVSSSLPQESPQHRDMQLQDILKEMTESVHMPLTGICTPLPKHDSRFPFPSSVNEKENSQTLAPSSSFIEDLHISDEDSDDERENNDEQYQRPANQTRSRSSSSSSSSSSGESSDSECEDVDDDKTNTTVFPKTSMLNSPPVVAKIPSPPVQQVPTQPKKDGNDNMGKSANETSHTQTHSKLNSGEFVDGKSRTSSTSDDSVFHTKIEEKLQSKELKDSSNNVEEVPVNELKTVDEEKPIPTSKHTTLLNKVKTESSEVLPDTKIKIKVEKGSSDSFKVKTDTKVKNETKRRSESESKQVGEMKNNAEKGKTAGKGSESGSKTSSKLGVKLKKTANGVVKIKKSGESKEEKIEVKKKGKNLDESTAEKKTKRKHKDSTGDTGKKEKLDSNTLKEKSDVIMSKDKTEHHSVKEKKDEVFTKDTNRTKSGNKEKKKSARIGSFGFDSSEVGEEDHVIDVVGDNSPVVKKTKTEQLEKKNGVNGFHKNGHDDMPLGIQLVQDGDKVPTSLIVKIPLSFLKRIPSRFAQELSVESSHADVELGSLENEGKKQKERLWKEHEENDMEVEHTDETEKIRPVNNHRKRSPSSEVDPHPKKRMRRDSHRDKSDQKKCKTAEEMNAECVADIRKVEPDAHLLRAKTLKREADKLTDKEAKSRTYVEAIIRFICCGKALEDKEDGEIRAGQMYSETTELLRFILKHVLGKTEDKRLLILCLRVQSLLLHKLYRMKGKQALRNTQILAEHFKASHKNNITSPYTTSNKHGSTPSPLSPTPSPAGSVGSIGSNGSNSSGEGNHSQNGRHASTAAVTSPMSVSIPQQIHSVMAQHVSNTSKLVNSIDMWDKADSLTSGYREFFITVDSICGPLTFHSSIPHIVNYVKNSLSYLHEHGKGT